MQGNTTMVTLMPRAGGRYLTPVEVIRRVEGEFGYVETTEEDARQHVLEWMNQLAFVAADGRAAADDTYLAQLEQLQDAACFMHFGDDIGSDGILLSMLMIPHQPLIIEAHAQDEETWFLIYRCVLALDYEVFEPEAVEGNVAPELPYSTPFARAA